MAVKRGPDGVPVDIPSVLHKKSNSSAPAGEAPTSLFGQAGELDIPTAVAEAPTEKSSGPASLFGDEPPTVPADKAQRQGQATAKSEIEDPRTVIAGGASRQKSASSADVGASSKSSEDPMLDPVVAWLVVVEGPGQGHYLKLGNGQNSIGRGTSERVCLDFGDEQISRSNHAVVTYDPRGREFYVQQGSGTNLAYLNDAPILAPVVLGKGNRISLGDTTLLFVPLCGDDFSWS